MSLDQLLKGLKVFQNGMQQLGVKMGIDEAQQQVNQMNEVLDQQIDAGAISFEDAMQERAQMQQQVSAGLIGRGASPQQVQAAFGNIAPSQNVMEQGRLSQQQQERRLGAQQEMQTERLESQQESQQLDIEARSEQAELDRKLRREMASQDRELRRELLNKKEALKEPPGKKLPKDLRKELSENFKSVNIATSLLNNFKDLEAETTLPRTGPGSLSDTPLLGWMRKQTNPRWASFQKQLKQFFNAYKKQISGAAVSDREKPDLLAAMPNPDDTPQVFEQSITDMLENLSYVRTQNLEMAKQQGVDIENLRIPDASPAPSQQRPAPAQQAPLGSPERKQGALSKHMSKIKFN